MTLLLLAKIAFFVAFLVAVLISIYLKRRFTPESLADWISVIIISIGVFVFGSTVGFLLTPESLIIASVTFYVGLAVYFLGVSIIETNRFNIFTFLFITLSLLVIAYLTVIGESPALFSYTVDQ